MEFLEVSESSASEEVSELEIGSDVSMDMEVVEICGGGRVGLE